MTNTKNSAWFIIYTILWLVYLMQGAIWGEGGVLSQGVLVILLVWSFGIYIYCIYKFKIPNSLKILSVLLICYVIYGIVPIVNNEIRYVAHSGTLIPPFSYMKAALVSILPVFTYYYYANNKSISTKNLKIFSLIFFVVIVIMYYTNEAKLARLALLRGSSATEFTNNISYGFIYLIPYLYLFKNKRNAIIFLLGISFFLLMGMKRGAILIGAIGIMLYLRDLLSNEKFEKKIISISLILLVLLAVGYIGYSLYEDSPYFQRRVEKTLSGATSGRDEIEASLLSYYWNDTNLLQVIFGSGANATLLHAVNFAHNDWIEMLIDQGLIGFILLLSFYVCLFKEVRKMRQYNKLYYQSFRTLCIITFIKTLFSMSIANMLPYLTLLLGYYLYQLIYYQNTKLCKKMIR